MIDNYVRSIRSSVPDGCSEISGAVLPVNSTLSSALKHLNKISSSFNNLINDEDGQSLFEEYAKANKIDDCLLFWFAVEGFKRRFNELEAKRKYNENYFQSEITHMSKAIYNNFIKNNAKSRVYQWFSKTTRETIYNRIANFKLDSNIFDDVKAEFELKIQEDIYPNFLKSDIFSKYADNIKNNCNAKARKQTNYAKNPYHQSYSNFHPTSTQGSEYQYSLKDEPSPAKNESKSERTDHSSSNRNKQTSDKQSENSKSTKSTTRQQCSEKSSLKQQQDKQEKKTESTNIEQTIVDQDRTLQVLASTGARSHLPNKPEDDMNKVMNFIERLDKVQQENRKRECDQRILNVIKNFELDGKQNFSLRNFLKKDVAFEDSQSILDKHCSLVFGSNVHSKESNSPRLNRSGNASQESNTPKKVLKLSTQIENRQNTFKWPLVLDSPMSANQLNNVFNSYKASPNNSYKASSNNSSKSTNHRNSTIIMYQYSDEIPYSIRTDTSAITLKRFKKEITKPPIGSNQRFRYFFKKKDQLENMYVMEELTDDNEYVPFCGDKVFAKIEIVSLQK